MFFIPKKGSLICKNVKNEIKMRFFLCKIWWLRTKTVLL